MKNITVVTVINKEKKIEYKFKDDLKTLQDVVGGYIEVPYISDKLFKNGIDIYINADGKNEDLPITALIVDANNNVLDTIQGNIVFASHDNEGNTTSLTEKQIYIVYEILQSKAITSDNEMVYVIKA